MIVTVTPNPSVDRTYRVGALRPGELHRAGAVRAEASGKGVNVGRVLGRLGARRTRQRASYRPAPAGPSW